MSMCSSTKPGTDLYVSPDWCTSSDRAVWGEGKIASTSPPRIAWISEFVSVRSLKSISFRPGFLPYQKGFDLMVTPWPFVQLVSMKGPLETGLPSVPQTQLAQRVFQSRPPSAFDGYRDPLPKRSR